MEEQKKEDTGKDVVINMDDLKGIMAEAVKDMTLPQIEELRAEMRETEQKHLFPSGDGTHFETHGKSIIDTRFFTKQYQSSPIIGGGYKDGDMMGAALRGGGGPFLKLSPVMEKFATLIKCKGDIHKAQAMGLNIAEYNQEIRESEAKIFGEKALTTTDAGALVPTEYLATVVEFATAQSMILPKLMRLPMGSLSLKIPKLAQAAGSYFGGITLYHPDEGGLKTATEPSFDDLTFTAKKLIGLINLTDELIADSSINIINYITGLFVRAFQYKTEGEVITGSGLGNQMTGIKEDTSINSVTRDTAGTVKYDDLINLESALDENFSNLTFLSRRATVNTFRKQKVSGSSDQPVYADGYNPMFGGAIPPTLLGYPVVKTRNVPAMGITGDIILGDLSFYIWAMRNEMTIDTSNAPRFTYDETTLRFVIRQDGAPGVSEAFAMLDGTLS